MSQRVSAGRSETIIVTGNTEKTKPENRAFYPALDGLRALAFLMVFFQHYLGLPWGWSGVDIFFVLSGFLITGILFDTRHDPHRVRNFYVRRTLRIFPLYYGVLIAIFALTPLLHWRFNWTWLVWPAYLGNYARFFHPYAMNGGLQRLADFEVIGRLWHHDLVLFLGHFWSLCVEEQFYLVWPWVVFGIRDRRKLLWVCALAVPFCLVLRLVGQAFLPTWMLDKEVLYRVTPFRLDALLFGGFLALALRGENKERYLRAARWIFPIGALITISWLLFGSSGTLWHQPYVYPGWKFTWGLSAIDLISGLLILESLQPGTLVYKVFNLQPLRWVGRISYGAYVLHDIPHPIYWSVCSMLVKHLAGRSAGSGDAVQTIITGLTGVVALPGTLVLAWLSYRWFESPFLNLKERWTARVID